jgi:hypothetical protein
MQDQRTLQSELKLHRGVNELLARHVLHLPISQARHCLGEKKKKEKKEKKKKIEKNGRVGFGK